MDQSDPTTEAELEFESLEDAPTPLHVIATDLLSGHELRLSEGDALDPRADARRPHEPLPSGVHEHLPRSAIAA